MYHEVCLLLVLYFAQGLPLGITMGSLPFLLQSKLSYAELGTFSLSSYPYSLKLFWSPVVDALYFSWVGRRKTWILPLQMIISVFLFVLSDYIGETVDKDVVPDTSFLASSFFVLVFLTATQDIAVDGWAVTLLPRDKQSLASTCQTIGLSCGYFLSFTIFLSFNSQDFCEKFFPNSSIFPISLSNFMKVLSFLFFVVNIFVVFQSEGKQGKEEKGEKKQEKQKGGEKEGEEEGEEGEGKGVWEVYTAMFRTVMLPDMQKLMLCLLFVKLGFVANESITPLQLIRKGFGEANMALFALITFPFNLVFAMIAGRYCRARPLTTFLYRGVLLRLVMSVVGPITVYFFPENETVNVYHPYFYVLLAAALVSSFANVTMFVAQGCFFGRISDKSIGGTYLTLLNTIANLGGTWPVFFVLRSVDALSLHLCVSKEDETITGEVCTPKSPSCGEGFECETVQNGYWYCCAVCSTLGLLFFVFFLRKTMSDLEKTVPKAWLVVSEKEE